jgi:hypothetical protein
LRREQWREGEREKERKMEKERIHLYYTFVFYLGPS